MVLGVQMSKGSNGDVIIQEWANIEVTMDFNRWNTKLLFFRFFYINIVITNSIEYIGKNRLLFQLYLC